MWVAVHMPRNYDVEGHRNAPLEKYTALTKCKVMMAGY